MRGVAVCGLALLMGSEAMGKDLNETLKLTSSDGEADDRFGVSVGVSGTRAVVGAWRDDGDSGSAYLFDVTTGQELVKLTASDGAGGDQFGWSVAVSGAIAVVGAPGDDDAGGASGSAYVFDIMTGQELFKLTASDGAFEDRFGYSVAVSGTHAVIGAWHDDDSGVSSGSAYVFDLTTGQEVFKFTASDAAAGDEFGSSVAVSGTRAVVGALADDDAGKNSGSAYVFDVTTGQELFKLTASDAAARALFGGSVAVSGTVAVVGARFDDGSGSAYVFDVTTGQELFKIAASDGVGDDQFGFSVAISGTLAVVGARFDDDIGDRSGSAYVFDVTTGQELFKLTASDAAVRDEFGYSVGVSGGRAVVGARLDDDAGDNSGSAYVFDLNGCGADLDGDGDADAEDFFAYLDLFASGDERADIDGDGDIDAEDFFGYLDLFAAGCP